MTYSSNPVISVRERLAPPEDPTEEKDSNTTGYSFRSGVWFGIVIQNDVAGERIFTYIRQQLLAFTNGGLLWSAQACLRLASRQLAAAPYRNCENRTKE